jgi:acetyl esterase/lipase
MYNNKLRYLIFLCFLALLAGCHAITEFPDPTNNYTPETTYKKLVGDYPFIAIASREVPASVSVNKNITYVKYGARHLQLDLYRPARTNKKLPVVVFVHGGGWMHGYRENFSAMAIRMAEQGYASALISYRLSPEAKYPAAIYDAKAAVRWLRTNAAEYRLDADHIAIAGGSAGGQIASLTGVTNGMRKFEGDYRSSLADSRVQAIVNIDGLSDFTSPEALLYENDPTKKVSAAGRWFGGRYEEKPEIWKEASPINYVSKSMPPVLFIGSAQARFSVGREQMVEKMKALDVPYQVVLLPDTPHSFWLLDPWLAPTVTAVTRFLNEQFRYAWP